MKKDDRTVFMESLQMWGHPDECENVTVLLPDEDIDDLVEELFARSFDLDDGVELPLAANG